MCTRHLLACLATFLLACGGGDDGSGSDEPSSTTGDEAVETSSTDDEAVEEAAATDESDDEEDDGMRCLPVSHCHSFANQDCALVDADGHVQNEQLSSGSVEQACPGQRGVADSVQECFDYVEISESCRTRPELRHPEWPCGRTDTARCAIVM
ncbi:MAG: hypothetical protein R3B82_03810 [Sandaracinaceae bacterium]